MQASLAPHDENEEPIYPGTCRPASAAVSAAGEMNLPPGAAAAIAAPAPAGIATHWRFRVSDGERIDFFDERVGKQSAIAGRDFGAFVVRRRDDVAAYQLAVVPDDAAMQVSEVVRGEDLLMSFGNYCFIARSVYDRRNFITRLWLLINPGNGLRSDMAHSVCAGCGNEG